MPPLFIEPEADSDLDAAFVWYEEQRPGLGSEFLAEVAHTLALIEEAPERYPVLRGSTRRALVRRFPYAVFYIVDPELIAVTAVMHGRRDPRRWQSRADA
ncbi:MAG TPA: type II toxin-antitoxin system RelE/ParE family toxin [Gemmatimonadales bacterium]|nr:type II toxin-antitoxin system RelE/ParE family toxin [Gemmatimonadales bacterium]